MKTHRRYADIIVRNILGGFFLFAVTLIALSIFAAPLQAATQPYISSHQVNFATGNKVHTETDISISGPVDSFSFVRTYNSQSTEESVLGYGWSWSFGEHLLLDLDDENIPPQWLETAEEHLQALPTPTNTPIASPTRTPTRTESPTPAEGSTATPTP